MNQPRWVTRWNRPVPPLRLSFVFGCVSSNSGTPPPAGGGAGVGVQRRHVRSRALAAEPRATQGSGHT